MPFSGGSTNLKALQRVMFFVDGSNLMHRLREANLRVPSLHKLLSYCCANEFRDREMVRVNFYSTQTLLKEGETVHGHDFVKGVRVVLGDEIVQDGKRKTKEKGVDALLVADLIYHAAQKNCDLAAIVSQDTDFRFAIKRVEDFGCRSAVVTFGFGCEPRLSTNCDMYVEWDRDYLLRCKSP
jgi:uncharacterized LabA/DUF88 family protein